MFHKNIFFVLSIFIFLNCNAELLQVSMDKTTFLSTDSLEGYKSQEEYMVRGLIYMNQNIGKKEFSQFSTSCRPNGGTLIFQKGDGSYGKEWKWSVNGKYAVDAIGITACKYVGYLKN
jgi:hypothetical protein